MTTYTRRSVIPQIEPFEPFERRLRHSLVRLCSPAARVGQSTCSERAEVSSGVGRGQSAAVGGRRGKGT